MSNFTDETYVPPVITYRAGGDPGAIGPGKLWIDASTEPPTVRVRNQANTSWDTVGGGGGGTGNVTIVSVPFDHTTPDLFAPAGAGLDLFTPAGILAGDLVFLPANFGSLSIDVAFNGTTPKGWIFGALPYNNGGIPNTLSGAVMTQVNASFDANDLNGSMIQASQWMTVGGWVRIANLLTKLRFIIDDGAGGNPGSTQGSGAITLAYARGVSV